VATARPRPIIVLVAVTMHLAIAITFTALRLVGTEPPLRPIDWPGAVVMGLAYALPALLGLLALSGRRPAALLAASVLSLLLAFTALSGVSLALLVPAVLDAVGYAHWTPPRWAPQPTLRLATLGLLAAIVLAGAAAFAALFWPAAGQTTYCWSVTVDRDGHTSYGRHVERLQAASGQIEQDLQPPGQGPGGATTVEQGCSDGVIGLKQAGMSLAIAAVALAGGLLLPRQPTPAL
jgi:hypothetical protein